MPSLGLIKNSFMEKEKNLNDDPLEGLYFIESDKMDTTQRPKLGIGGMDVSLRNP
jgi:hypothetical protein